MYTITMYSVYTGTLCEPVHMYTCVKEKQTKEVYTTREKMQGKVHIFGATQQTCKQCMARTVKI